MPQQNLVSVKVPDAGFAAIDAAFAPLVSQLLPHRMTIPQSYLQTWERLCRAVDNALTLTGVEALQATLMFYNRAKQGAKPDMENASVIYNDLSTRLPGTARTKAEQPQARMKIRRARLSPYQARLEKGGEVTVSKA